MNIKETRKQPEVTRRKLVDAGVKLMRLQGFNATTVDDICAEAGVTKGGFFHYFKNKDDVARAAVSRFQEDKTQIYQEAPFRQLADPLDRVFGRLDFAKEAIGGGKGLTKGCLIGVFAQELAFTNSELRKVCQGAFTWMARDFEADLTAAKAIHAPKAGFDPKKLAQFYISIIQGSLIMAKASGSNDVYLENIEQFRSHLKELFGQGQKPGRSVN
ncbi:MAG TPA: TetR/AcrR family transcriptional regulator [Pseudomonadales bacterium]|nr:TetR/AcrR family transcriptional regulator [Pseudomonadales bacterium]